jgi:hypothetical protein
MNCPSCKSTDVRLSKGPLRVTLDRTDFCGFVDGVVCDKCGEFFGAETSCLQFHRIVARRKLSIDSIRNGCLGYIRNSLFVTADELLGALNIIGNLRITPSTLLAWEAGHGAPNETEADGIVRALQILDHNRTAKVEPISMLSPSPYRLAL